MTTKARVKSATSSQFIKKSGEHWAMEAETPNKWPTLSNMWGKLG